MDSKHIKYITNNNEESLTINDSEPTLEDLQHILCELIKEDSDKEALKSFLTDYVITIGKVEEEQDNNTYKFIYTLDI
jgi:hypothetical protein